MTLPPHIGEAQTPFGPILYLKGDAYIGKGLARYGEFSMGEVMLFAALLKPGDRVIEAGANIGCHTVAMAEIVGRRGFIYAYEPQRVLWELLCSNVSRYTRSFHNRVGIYGCALGAECGTAYVPDLDYTAENNFGALSLSDNRGNPVPLATIDTEQLPPPDFLKIDVEGMELDVLQGAAKTIQRFQPAIYVENDRKDRSAALIEHLWSLNYRLWWHIVPLFNPNNFAGVAENIFGETVSINMLALPSGREPPEDFVELEPVRDAGEDFNEAYKRICLRLAEVA